MKTRYKILSAALFAALFSASLLDGSFFAFDNSEKGYNSIYSVKQKIEQNKASKREFERRRDELTGGINDISSQVFKLEDLLESNQRELESLKKNEENNKGILRKIVKTAELIDNSGYDLCCTGESFGLGGSNREGDGDVVILAANVREKLEEIKKNYHNRKKAADEISKKQLEVNRKREDIEKKQRELERLEETNASELRELNEEYEKQKNKNIAPPEVNKTKGAVQEISHENNLNRGSNGDFIWPCRCKTVLQRFKGFSHRGIDISGSEKDIICSVCDGVVDQVNVGGYGGGWGSFVLIKTEVGGEKITIRYAHLSEVSVRKGEFVKKGGQIGLMGRTGRATCVHLHIEITRNGTHEDPMRWLGI
ncbi:MAG: peptidoglycan DD-metalloendopeptidase family protein [Oscillospiraceae bacterium]|nr:peptidoglycan DD-metalloendopeptidase family protein [Oscillospiraceae bacterium]